MDDENSKLFAFLAGALAVAGFLSGAYLGSSTVSEKAVLAGVAHYESDPVTGKSVFKFNSENNPHE